MNGTRGTLPTTDDLASHDQVKGVTNFRTITQRQLDTVVFGEGFGMVARIAVVSIRSAAALRTTCCFIPGPRADTDELARQHSIFDHL